MYGYHDLAYFRTLDFWESLDCYIHLKQDLENRLTIEKITQMLSFASTGPDGLEEVDSIVDELF